jgi:hypothetical protein
MRLVLENLPRAYATPDDLEARANMMSRPPWGLWPSRKGLGAIHSLSHPVGAVYNTHHGTTNAVVMPMVLDFNRAAIEDRKRNHAITNPQAHPGADVVLRAGAGDDEHAALALLHPVDLVVAAEFAPGDRRPGRPGRVPAGSVRGARRGMTAPLAARDSGRLPKAVWPPCPLALPRRMFERPMKLATKAVAGLR